RIDDLMQQRPTIAAPSNPVPLKHSSGAIEFRNVVVEFGGGRHAVNDVSFRIEAGTTVAIVGHTGSGKSTLVHLIPRLLDPTAGSIRLDGHDVREYNPADLRSQIGFVPQETFLFSDTLAGIISFGVPDAKDG